MEKNQALSIFGLTESSDQEELFNAIEEKLFALKNEVLQKYMVPTLINKKINSIQDIMVAEFILLGGQIPVGNEIRHWNSSPGDRIAMISQYEEQISHLKLETMNSRTFQQLHKVMQAFILTQEYYMVLFRMLYNEFSEALPEEVNTREMIDTGKLLLALRSGTLDERTVWDIEREIARIEKIQKLA
ncbi:MAG: hypothetical protein IPP69_09780 [Flavobacteriales bacterium]|nr:hypothetical protein [Flavobacteriales bacterium]